MVKFDTQQLKSLFSGPETYALALEGTVLKQGERIVFLGFDTLRVIFSGDINHDLSVDIFDAALLAFAYGFALDSPNWNVDADLTHEGIIDILDAVMLAMIYGAIY